MTTTKKALYTLATGMFLGMLLGILYAPDKGKVTRRKLDKLKRKLQHRADEENEDKETLEEVSEVLEAQLEKVNRRLAN